MHAGALDLMMIVWGVLLLLAAVLGLLWRERIVILLAPPAVSAFILTCLHVRPRVQVMMFLLTYGVLCRISHVSGRRKRQPQSQSHGHDEQ